MPTDLRPYGSVTLAPIGGDVEVLEYPCTITRKFVDYYQTTKKLTISPRLRTLEQWAGATISGLRWVDELEGATLTPKYLHYQSYVPMTKVSTIGQIVTDTNTSIIPCHWDYYSGINIYDSGTRIYKYDKIKNEVSKRDLIMSFSTALNGSTDGNFITRNELANDTGGKWTFGLFSPKKDPSDTSNEMKHAGVWVFIGMRVQKDEEGNSLGSCPQYGLYIPTNRDIDNNPESAYMQFWKFTSVRDTTKVSPTQRWNGSIIDQTNSPFSFVSSGEDKIHFLNVQYETICGQMYFTFSMNDGSESNWLVTSEIDLRISAGRGATKIFGMTGYCGFATIYYSETATINIIKTIYRPEISLTPHLHLVGDERYSAFTVTPSIIEDSEAHGATIGLTITNTSLNNRATPVFYELQEYHETVFNEAIEEFEPIDISEYVTNLDIQYGEFFRGSTATLTCRNFNPAVASSNGELAALLSGSMACTIEMAQHNGEEVAPTPATIYQGYIVEKPVDVSGIHAKMTIKLQDKTCLFGKLSGKSPSRVAGWDFKAYTSLILNNEFIHGDNIYYPLDYVDGSWKFPHKYGDWSMDFSPEASVVDVLDKCCEVAMMTWEINQYGNVVFRWKYPKDTTPVFTLNSTSEEAEYVEVLDSSANLNEIASIYIIKGTDANGYPFDYTFKWMPAYDEAKPYYIGRDKYKLLTETNIPNVLIWAQDQIIEEYQNSVIIGWTSRGGKNIWPGSCVLVDDLPDVGFTSEKFEVVSKSSSLKWDGQREMWIDSYTARIIVESTPPLS